MAERQLIWKYICPYLQYLIIFVEYLPLDRKYVAYEKSFPNLKAFKKQIFQV